MCTGEHAIAGEVNAANVGRNDPTNPLNVNEWNRDNGNPNTGGLSAVVSSTEVRVGFAWWILSIHQASCLFLEVLLQVLNIFYPPPRMNAKNFPLRDVPCGTSFRRDFSPDEALYHTVRGEAWGEGEIHLDGILVEQLFTNTKKLTTLNKVLPCPKSKPCFL